MNEKRKKERKKERDEKKKGLQIETKNIGKERKSRESEINK